MSLMKLPLKLGLMVGLPLIGLLLFLRWSVVPRSQPQAARALVSENRPPPASKVTQDVLEIPKPNAPAPPRPPLPPAPPDPFRENPTPEIAGIGAALKIDEGELRIIQVLHGSPAERAGLVAGWIVDKVDGLSMRDTPLVECVQAVRGAAGTKVKLELIDPETNERKTYEVTREKIRL
jgi:hypothetical protein